MGKRILITGISGFLASNLAEQLIKEGNQVIGVHRSGSDLWRCEGIKSEICWINIDSNDWESEVVKQRPEVFFHSAWEGVTASDRDDWKLQGKNLELLMKLLVLAHQSGVRKFVALGSQAEYGFFSESVSEQYPLNPTTAYGAVKIVASNIIKYFCDKNKIDWVWLRLFSFFGEKEGQSWFIPSLVKKIAQSELIELTPGEQRYAYMYVDDLARIISKVISTEVPSDYYNLSSERAISIKRLVEEINDIIQPSESRINFGAIPYRPSQPMHVQGDSSKLMKQLNTDSWETDFKTNLTKVVNHILNVTNNEK